MFSRMLIFLLILVSQNLYGAEKFGILLGTFDPPHRGHLQIAINAAQELGLSKVYIIPNFDAAHKPHATSSAHRLRMSQLAFGRYSKLEVVDEVLFQKLFQIKLEKGSDEVYRYFVENDTSESEWYQIAGSDVIERYGSTGQIATLQINHPRLVLAITGRGEISDKEWKFVEANKNRALVLKNASPDVSSTKIRNLFSQGAYELVEELGLIHKDVLRYVVENDLYPHSPNPSNSCQANIDP